MLTTFIEFIEFRLNCSKMLDNVYRSPEIFNGPKQEAAFSLPPSCATEPDPTAMSEPVPWLEFGLIFMENMCGVYFFLRL